MEMNFIPLKDVFNRFKPVEKSCRFQNVHRLNQNLSNTTALFILA